MADWVAAVSSNDLDLVWERSRKFIEAALGHADARFSVSCVKEWLHTNRAQLFIYGGDLGESGYPLRVGAALVATTHDRIWGRSLLILAFGADDLRHVLPSLRFIELFAHVRGYSGVELRAVTGRRGWIRVLAPFGYRHVGNDEDGDAVLLKEI